MPTPEIYQSSRIADRQIDTLIGMAKGILADGKINQAEAEFLLSWFMQNTDNRITAPVFKPLLDELNIALADNYLTEEEANKLKQRLIEIAGDKSEIGEETKSTEIHTYTGHIDFLGSVFMFTGTFSYGTRSQCLKAIETLGGIPAKSLSRKVNYLVIGDYAAKAWMHESFGQKIMKAIELNEKNADIRIITENHWLSQMNNT